MNKKNRQEFFNRLLKDNPRPTTELVYSSDYQLLISVILSAQATDVSVNKVTQKLYETAPDALSMSNLSVEEISSYINTIGLYKNKAKYVKETSKKLISLHNGVVPRERSLLEALPGVGRKTANVILNTAFGEKTIAVDTHIFRVANRTTLAPGKNPLEVERLLNRSTPKEFKKNAHHWLLLHGRYVCRAKAPTCGACLVSDLCGWTDRQLYSQVR
ncbi:MAG: endonuclease III [Pseudomonadota bacterium]|nr:endonuclease III [Pseudomonadota bacterium]